MSSLVTGAHLFAFLRRLSSPGMEEAMCASAAMAVVASQVFLVCSASGDAHVH